METNVRYKGCVAIVDLRGGLVAGNESDSLRATLFQILNAGHRNLLLNCAELDHVDSGGLGDLVDSYITIKRLGGVVKVLRPHRRLRELLEVTRLDSLIEVFDDEAKALEGFPANGDAKATQNLTDYLES